MHTLRDLWIQNLVLGGVVGLLAWLYFAPPDGVAHAAGGGGWGTNGVMAMCANMEQQLVLVDTNKQSICAYRNYGAGKFQLVAARSYKYDIQMKDAVPTWVSAGQGRTFIEVKHAKEGAEARPKKGH